MVVGAASPKPNAASTPGGLPRGLQRGNEKWRHQRTLPLALLWLALLIVAYRLW
jgi:hypothetical protein